MTPGVYLTIPQALAIVREAWNKPTYNRRALHHHILSGNLPAIRPGNEYFITRADLERFIAIPPKAGRPKQEKK